MNIRCRYIFATLALVLAVGDLHAQSRDSSGAEFIHRWNRAITEVMMEDGFSPAASARFFSYLHVAAYEAARHASPEYRSYAGLVRDLRPLPAPDSACTYDWRVAAMAAYKATAAQTLFRIYITDSLYEASMNELTAAGLSDDVRACSELYGVAVAKHVLAWMKPDGYVSIQASGKYVIPKYEGAWEPTAPDFKEPADPFWATVRGFTIDSAAQIPAAPAVAFSSDTSSEFHAMAREVYFTTRDLTPEQAQIALFWNDTPVRSHHHGHLMFASRQISPPGHWLSITQTAAKMRSTDMVGALAAYSSVSIAIHDALLSCWHSKYHTNVMRPETYINRYIDSTWYPLIQTPPFPEHTSGHSSISGAASTVLTHLFGPMAFTDSTEERFGWGVRSFDSFAEAAEEAAMSRLYGGIHYRHGNDAGLRNGRAIGEHVATRLVLRTTTQTADKGRTGSPK